MNRPIILILLLILLTSCQCIKNEPACGADQKTYANKCMASLAGVDSVTGECTVPKTCEKCGISKPQDF